jgi:photosystem II stability/assembly factor-like uncharacterized protein
MNTMRIKMVLVALAVGICALGRPCDLRADPVDGQLGLQHEAAEHVDGATQEMMLSAVLAGKRIVAVGNRGVVLLSDDDGTTFRQARTVPVSTTLTGVSFADPNVGWAVGHWGTILKTADGGETWSLQRSDVSVDQPLLSVYFKSAEEGWAVGLWSLMLHTTDGGATWSIVSLPPPQGAKRADRNLYDIFPDTRGNLFIACEQGRVMRSTDGGQTWSYLETGYTGSFWTGTVLADGTVIVGGLRGSVYRSQDGGNTWTTAKSTSKSSVTQLQQLPDGVITAVALDGVTLTSRDDGLSFTAVQRKDRVALTAEVKAPNGDTVVFSAGGPLHRGE